MHLSLIHYIPTAVSPTSTPSSPLTSIFSRSTSPQSSFRKKTKKQKNKPLRGNNQAEQNKTVAKTFIPRLNKATQQKKKSPKSTQKCQNMPAHTGVTVWHRGPSTNLVGSALASSISVNPYALGLGD